MELGKKHKDSDHPMDDYIFTRMVMDAQHVINLGNQQQWLEHSGLVGRFRELLVNGILQPWLPPIIKCGTGTVISQKNIFRSKTQEDILLIDQSLSPSILVEKVFRKVCILETASWRE